MTFLLDTNILSDLVRHPEGKAASRVRKTALDDICTSIVAAAELRFGGAKNGSKRLIFQIEEVLGSINIVALMPPFDEIYAEQRAALELKGLPIGALDMLIAAHALTLDATLVTDNVREFSRVPGLKIENWLR